MPILHLPILESSSGSLSYPPKIPDRSRPGLELDIEVEPLDTPQRDSGQAWIPNLIKEPGNWALFIIEFQEAES